MFSTGRESDSLSAPLYPRTASVSVVTARQAETVGFLLT